jgi:hypothetical protein
MTSTFSRPAVRDSLFLAAIVLASSSLYVGRLGFYSDDWFWFDSMSRAESRSIPAMFRYLLSDPFHAMRPGQLLYFATLHSLFGTVPLGYHLVNTLAFAVMAVFLYLALRSMLVDRTLAVSIALVFVLLPHYSSTRFWFSAFGHMLSMVLYCASLFALLRALTAPDRWRWWLAASILALVASGSCYEVPMPLFAFNAGLACFLAPRLSGTQGGLSVTRTRALKAAATTIVSLMLVAAFKKLTTVRLGSEGDHSPLKILRRALRLGLPPESYGLNLEQALRTNFGEYGVGLPRLVLQVLRDGPPISTLVLTVVGAVAVGGYLLALGRSSETIASERTTVLRQSAVLLIGGFGLFWLGYAIFLTNSNLQFTTTGIGNRANIGAAAGVAVIFVGVAQGLSALCPSAMWRVRVFGLVVAVLFASSILLNNVLAGQWIQAYERERAILADLHHQQPVLPPRTTLILDGVCPYIGPAIVFEANWDLKGALRLMYRESSLEADVATDKMSVEPLELVKTLYGDASRYPFTDGLLVYDQRSRTVHPLSDPQAARRYFAARTFNPARDCPPGHEGLGAPAW